MYHDYRIWVMASNSLNCLRRRFLQKYFFDFQTLWHCFTLQCNVLVSYIVLFDRCADVCGLLCVQLCVYVCCWYMLRKSNVLAYVSRLMVASMFSLRYMYSCSMDEKEKKLCVLIMVYSVFYVCGRVCCTLVVCVCDVCWMFACAVCWICMCICVCVCVL